MNLAQRATPAGGGSFWAETFEVLTLRGGHNTTVVVLGTAMLGLAAGVVGVFALLRKRSLMADALSHAALPGVAGAFLVAAALGLSGRTLPVLLLGATITGVLGVLCIQWLVRATRLREDAAIGIVLSVFFGAGIVLLSYIQKNAPEGAAGLSHFIYGQTAAMSTADAQLMAGLAALSMVAAGLLLKEFTLVCFNDAFASVDGWPVSLIDLLMMALVVVVTVAGLQAVGLIMVVAMLIIPPVAARFWTDRAAVLIALSAGIGAISGYLGASASAVLPDAPAGSVIVLTSGALFALGSVAAPKRGVIASAYRHLNLRLRIAGDHVLERAFIQHAQRGGQLGAPELAAVARHQGWPAWFALVIRWSLRVRGLARSNKHGGVMVLAPGLARGATVRRNHRLWEQYLVSYADIAPSHVDWSVDQVEHVLSEPLIAELESLLRARGIVVPRAVADGANA